MITQTATTYTNNKKGSSSVETAIAMTATLIFICSIISIIVFYRADILMQRSIVQACEEYSLISPLQITASDAVSTLINLFPDKKAGTMKGAELIKKVGSALIGFDAFSGNSIENIILENTAAHTLANKIRSGYIVRNNNSDFYVPDMIDVDLNIDHSRNIMEVRCDYTIITLAGNIRRSMYQTVPMYGRFELFLNDGSDKEEDDIWSKDNFTRGDFFLEEQGANLPKTFPVINSLSGGVAKSIVSIDLTAPTYSSKSRITKLITSEVDSLRDFDGAHVIIDGKRYWVSSSDMKVKVLTVIIPKNSPKQARDAVESMREYADQNNIRMNIFEYGTSKRYG